MLGTFDTVVTLKVQPAIVLLRFQRLLRFATSTVAVERQSDFCTA